MLKMIQEEFVSLRAHFPITTDAVYLDHAAVGSISNGVRSGIQRQADLHANHIVNARPEFGERYAATRRALARLVGSDANRIAFVQNTSHGLSMIANGQGWQPGDNVVVPAMEFPSNYLPWLRLENLGVEVRRVDATEGRITPNALSAAIDGRTRIVAISAVQYYNGFRVDLAAVAEVVRAHDALLVVGGTQAVGAICLDVSNTGVDALVVSSHKWMLGPLGIGFMALSDRALERTEVTEIGWLSVNEPFAFRREIDLPSSADRFEAGTENAPGLFGLCERLVEIEQFGATRIEARVLGLTAHLKESLRKRGYEITSPLGEAEASGILTFRKETIDVSDTVSKLRNSGIFLSARHGSFRASPHYYNTEDEIDELVSRINQIADRAVG